MSYGNTTNGTKNQPLTNEMLQAAIARNQSMTKVNYDQQQQYINPKPSYTCPRYYPNKIWLPPQS